MTSLLSFLARYRLLLRLIISIALMAWLLSQVNLGTVVDRWSAVNWLLLLISIPFLYLLNTYLRTVRLRLILLAQGFRLPFRWLWLVQLRSSFVVTFLPGGVAGDIYRTFAIGREAQR